MACVVLLLLCVFLCVFLVDISPFQSLQSSHDTADTIQLQTGDIKMQNMQ